MSESNDETFDVMAVAMSTRQMNVEIGRLINFIKADIEAVGEAENLSAALDALEAMSHLVSVVEHLAFP